MIIKKNIVLFLLMMGFSFSAYSATYYQVISNDSLSTTACGGLLPKGAVISSSYCVGKKVSNGTKTVKSLYIYGMSLNLQCERGGCGRIAAHAVKVSQCPDGLELNPATQQCEDPCKQMEGESLGTVTFPDGTRDVATLCRNSCRAKSDLFFPAATPPYGVFTYTGESCDGSESSGGDTGGGDTGGGDTGGGDTGGGDTGGGDTGGGDTDGDGLTKAQLQDALQSFFGKSGSFNAPGQGDGYAYNTPLYTEIGDLKTEIDDLEETLESKLKQSPLKLGQMSFSDGSYEATTFSLSRWDVDVGFNLFSSLGSSNTNMIRTVILFLATLLAGFILLSSGRSKV